MVLIQSAKHCCQVLCFRNSFAHVTNINLCPLGHNDFLDPSLQPQNPAMLHSGMALIRGNNLFKARGRPYITQLLRVLL